MLVWLFVIAMSSASLGEEYWWEWSGGPPSGPTKPFPCPHTPGAVGFPSARSGAASCTSLQDHSTYLVGGTGIACNTGEVAILGDVWKRAPGDKNWTFVGGNPQADFPGSNTEFAGRTGASCVAFTDQASKETELVIFGGRSDNQYFGDVWGFTETAGQFFKLYDPPNCRYHLSQNSSLAHPGCRTNAAMFFLNSDPPSFGIFGGNNLQQEKRADYFTFDMQDKLWSWIKGDGGGNPTPDWPEARTKFAWSLAFAHPKTLTIFGGQGEGGTLSDLWNIDLATATAFLRSPMSPDPVSYGTLGEYSNETHPGPRFGSAMFSDLNKDVLLVAGAQSPSTGFNDIFSYNGQLNQWAWVGGTDTPNSEGNRGTENQPAAGNSPQATQGFAASYSEGLQSQTYCVFGGEHTVDIMQASDVWCLTKVAQDTTAPTTAAPTGASTGSPTVTPGTPTVSPTPRPTLAPTFNMVEPTRPPTNVAAIVVPILLVIIIGVCVGVYFLWYRRRPRAGEQSSLLSRSGLSNL